MQAGVSGVMGYIDGLREALCGADLHIGYVFHMVCILSRRIEKCRARSLVVVTSFG